ncbi:MAG: diguanylate cyclase [Gammaproteobacteria bacterium]|nr:diguanylate cyclase [Gammaproteobacteria bacterium]MBL7000885.1 diguanylate cyclase [Gammaproteobacteria bacterium]
MPDFTDLPVILLLTVTPFTKKSFEKLLNGRFRLEHVETAEQAWSFLLGNPTVSALVCELDAATDETAILERIRNAEDKLLTRLPVMLLVGEKNDQAALEQAFAEGATDFIYMPFSSDELVTRVQLLTRQYSQLSDSSSFELASQNSPVDLLNTQMQEKYFNSQLAKELSFSVRHLSYLSACLINIDNAARIEQEHGKSIMRAVLRAVVKLLEQVLRREDVFAYFGEQTFAVMYPMTNALGAHTATQRLVDKIQATRMKHEGLEISVSLSVGFYSTLPSETLSVEQIMSVLEQRLDKAQQQGGGAIVSGRTDQEKLEISMEQALNMIKFNRADELLGQIPQLSERLFPLLDFIQKNNQLEYSKILDQIDDED